MASRLTGMSGEYKFQSLDLYHQALDYLDELAAVTELLPARKSASLGTRLLDSATHLIVQVAAKSAGESEIERSFMVDGAMMSLFETVACLDIIRRRKLVPPSALERADDRGAELHRSLRKIKNSLRRR